MLCNSRTSSRKAVAMAPITYTIFRRHMELDKRILAAVTGPGYSPLKPKALARKLGLAADDYADFKHAVRGLIKQGRLELARNNTLRAASTANTVTGVFRKTSGGFGFVRPATSPAGDKAAEIYIPQENVGDAATGDAVLVRIGRKSKRPDQGPRGEIVRVLERATRQFVGTYFERD